VNIRLKKKSSHHGVAVPDNKITNASPIEATPLPEKVVLLLQQNIGAPSKALVKRGDKVLTGQKIADADELMAVPVHASISGEVTSVTTTINPVTGNACSAVVITSDGEDKWVELSPVSDLETLSADDIVQRVREGGVVGLGGAQFPTHVKLVPPEEINLDTVIINGCESEPYITTDHRTMLDYGEEVLGGINIIKKVLQPKNIYLAIEDNKEDAIDYLEKLINEKGYDFQLIQLEGNYPQCGEKTLVKTILGIEVPRGKLPMHLGVLVQNVQTAKAIYEAVMLGKPLVEKAITVSGQVSSPKNLMARIGTPIDKMIESAGGASGNNLEVVIGGLMMGISIADIGFPVCKGTSGILVKELQPIMEAPCISCGRCVEACPMKLMPTLYPKYVKAGRYEECEKAYVDVCTECGACAYACPANIPIVQYIKVAKNELRRRAVTK
jgi:electron transport complex protein RnfC